MIEEHHFKIWNAEKKHWEKPPSKPLLKQCWIPKGDTFRQSIEKIPHKQSLSFLCGSVKGEIKNARV